MDGLKMNSKGVALVTGASSGLGKDFALRLLSEGYVVYGAARRTDRMRDIEAAGGFALELDVTDDASMVAAVERIVRRHGRVDVLINNAGYGQMGAIEDVPIDDARRQLEVNLFGVGRLTQLCLPHMRERGFGKIINVSSIGGKLSTPLGGWYHASKFGLEGYSDALRMEVRRFGIDVIVIEPGGIDSEWGSIAKQQLERVSAKGAYRQLVSAVANSKTWMRNMPPPSVITELVVKALRAKKPKTRYHPRGMAGISLFLKYVLPDRMFDRLMMRSIR